MLCCTSAGLTEGNELRSIEAQPTNVQCAWWRERLEMVIRRQVYMLLDHIAFGMKQSYGVG